MDGRTSRSGATSSSKKETIHFDSRNDRRHFLGLDVTSGCHRINVVIAEVLGRNLGIRLGKVRQRSIDIPNPVTARFQRLRACRFESPGDAALLSRELASLQASVVTECASQTGIDLDSATAIGVCDPGLWHLRQGDSSCYTGLCDPSSLATRTGCNVIDAFPAGDLAAGGQGGPTSAVPLWLLLKDPAKSRLILDLGRTARLTYLPPGRTTEAMKEILSFDVGPGTNLLDYLAHRFSDGKIEFDPGGRLAVQGRSIDSLIEHWQDDPYFQQPLPRWSPVGVQPYDELEESVRMAADTGWSVRDLLCTATHFIVRSILRAIEHRIPSSANLNEIVLIGGGAQNGLLLSELAKKLPDAQLISTPALGIPDRALDATVAAILAALCVDRAPGNPQSVTGALSQAVLGRLTPGNPAAWSKLVDEMSSRATTSTTLREAV